MLALSFSVIFGPPHLKWSWIALLFLHCSQKCLTQQLSNGARQHGHFCQGMITHSVREGYNCSPNSLHQREHLTIWKLNSVKENTQKQEESQKKWFIVSVKEKSGRKKDLSEDRRKSTKWKIAAGRSVSLLLRSYCTRCEADVSSDRQVIWSHGPHNTCQATVFRCR